mmetsp:Transcript_22568/g.32237  ORF Transcript_22568/g.32237 Transcript_22568/m.32237 type:complete len:426 (+) Transcript_22568:161-1438(+)
MTTPAPETDRWNEVHRLMSTDEVAIIFSFLSHVEIMRARVCTTWEEAAKKAIVPPTEFRVHSDRSYNAMRAMATALPNLQQISILDISWLGSQYTYNSGEDPEEELTQHTANCIAHDVNIISNFKKLRSLNIDEAPLNGRYPVLFDFKYLQQLSIKTCEHLKFDLEILSGTPQLKELDLFGYTYSSWARNGNSRQTGNLSALRVLKGTLEKVRINFCRSIRGNFLDLADFPCLKVLELRCTAVTGDIRDMSEHDFPALKSLYLPDTVRGGMGYKFQGIAEVPDYMHIIHQILLRSPKLFEVVTVEGRCYDLSETFGWSLSKDSPDWYHGETFSPAPPFELQIIQAGSRLGWSWCSKDHEYCEINWLDPEPSSESSDYDAYIQKLQLIQQGHVNIYKGYHHPPNVSEYRRIESASILDMAISQFLA